MAAKKAAKTAKGTNKPARPSKDLPKGQPNKTQRKGVDTNNIGGEGSPGGQTRIYI